MNFTRIVCFVALATLQFVAGVFAAASDEKLPQVTVSNIRRAFYNGEHNAFTDLCRFRGQLYLTFRSCPEGHMVHPSASIIVLRSRRDGGTWNREWIFVKG